MDVSKGCNNNCVVFTQKKIQYFFVIPVNPYKGKVDDKIYAELHEKYSGVYDGEAANYLLKDKLEIEVIRNYLWDKGRYTLESVCMGSVRIKVLYCVGSVRFRTRSVRLINTIALDPYALDV